MLLLQLVQPLQQVLTNLVGKGTLHSMAQTWHSTVCQVLVRLTAKGHAGLGTR
jgi:hypothetical protein